MIERRLSTRPEKISHPIVSIPFKEIFFGVLAIPDLSLGGGEVKCKDQYEYSLTAMKNKAGFYSKHNF